MELDSVLHTSKISSVSFNLSGSETNAEDSWVEIKYRDMFRNNLPYDEGVHDAHLGTIDHSYQCQTCHHGKKNCLGHDGHLLLNYPVINPLAIAAIRKWIRIVCFNCGRLPVSEDAYRHLPMAGRLEEELFKIIKSEHKCVWCNTPIPVIKRDNEEPLLLIAEYYEEKKLHEIKKLYPHELQAIFGRVTPETIAAAGQTGRAPPSNYTLNIIKIPPTNIRPDVKKASGGRSTNDDLTTLIQYVITKHQLIPSVLPEVIDNKLEKLIYDLQNAYFNMIKGNAKNTAIRGASGQLTSIIQRLRGKMGRFRKTQMGKRVRNMGRSTITGNVSLRPWEVGIPMVFARTLQVMEYVQEYNRKELMVYVNNGTKLYPGATKIIKGNSGAEYNVENVKIGDNIDLEVGDIVFRDLINGDIVGFNRQPSLMVSNISAMEVVVIKDPNVRTFQFNVTMCALFHADFDGDQMNIILVRSRPVQHEQFELSSVANWFISHTTSAPSCGQVDDSIIGSFELTRDNVRFNRFQAMDLFNNTTFIPKFDEPQDYIYTGRDIVSKVLQPTPVNFARSTSWYSDGKFEKLIKYSPTEIKVKIENGVMKTGVLDKKSIGKGAAGGLYHVINAEYGSRAALESLFNLQQVTISFMMKYGYTIGIMDLVLPDAAKIKIAEISGDLINKSQLITDRLNTGNIIPPVGKTIEEFYEENQIQALSVLDDFQEPILSSINPDTNNLFKLIMSGSKGSISNMFNMVSTVGQRAIDGARIKFQFGPKRTLAYFQRFDTSPESRGFVTHSYMAGISTSEFIFNSMAARFDFVVKALFTSITGEQNRKSIKNLESIITNNYRWAAKGANVIQLVYGEDFLDPRKVESVKFPTVNISDAEMEQFKYDDPNPIFIKEYERILEDRRKYRTLFLNIENCSTNEPFSDTRKVAFDLERIVRSVLAAAKDRSEPSLDDLKLMVGAVASFNKSLVKVFTNSLNSKIDFTGVFEYDHLNHAAWLPQMQIRAFLCASNLKKLKISMQMLNVIFDKVINAYSRALVDPGTAVGIIAAQAFNEPLTQYMLDATHRSAVGGTKMASMNRSKEVLSARPFDALVNPIMFITPRDAKNKAKVTELANTIEVMKLHQFVTVWQIFYEKWAEPQHPDYAHETAIYREFAAGNPILRPPADLIRWCIRYEINKTELILKNMPLELIVNKLREIYPDIYLVYTAENSPKVIIRIGMRNVLFKKALDTAEMELFNQTLLDTTIRGINGISSVNVVKLLRHNIQSGGNITQETDQYAISTIGTNMYGVSQVEGVDKYKLLTNAIPEIEQFLGIEAARSAIMNEMYLLVDICSQRFYQTYADEMTYTGVVSSIERGGLGKREANNILLRLGYGNSAQVIQDTALEGVTSEVGGITAELLVGGIPRIGTLYNDFQIDEEFVKQNVKSTDSIIDDL